VQGGKQGVGFAHVRKATQKLTPRKSLCATP
jgi:hypothetical protein